MNQPATPAKALHHPSHQQHRDNNDNNNAANNIPAKSANTSTATIATLNTPELLEHILTYLRPIQLLRLKRINHAFRNAIQASPTLRRSTATFFRARELINERDLFRSEGGGEVVFPVRGVEVVAFFYPEDQGRRWFGRFGMDDDGVFRRLSGKSVMGQQPDGASFSSSSFGALKVVDLELRDVKVGWHCGRFRAGRAEAGLSPEDEECEGKADDGAERTVRFRDVFSIMDKKHRDEGFEGCCEGVRKFWVDGLWERSMEIRELGR